MRISEYENFVTIPDREHIANQDDELINATTELIWNALPSSVKRKMTEQESDEAWNAWFELAKSERRLL
ncbi:hypothetical protein [Providencia sp. PROV129]|uniref:hypothetical protein n=1 Tax=Providencia sp. PROV129 TaxID=2949839 RepID=UPI00234A1AAE